LIIFNIRAFLQKHQNVMENFFSAEQEPKLMRRALTNYHDIEAPPKEDNEKEKETTESDWENEGGSPGGNNPDGEVKTFAFSRKLVRMIIE
jgi:hypothetical protein